MAVALAFAWLCGWGTGLAHVVAEAHVYCGEHQQFEELGHADAAEPADPHDHGAEARSRDGGDVQGHEGCDVLESRPLEDGLSTAALFARAETPRTPTLAISPPRARSIKLYRLAPKASPPHAA